MAYLLNVHIADSVPLPVTVGAIALPAGASTAALQLPNNHQVTVSNLPALQAVSAAALPLPTGAATAALQLPNNHQVAVSNLPATQPVSAVALPLPTGAATSALQLPNNHQVTVSNFPASTAVTLPGVASDAFSRLRVSDPVTLLAVQQQYDNNPLLMEGGASGAGVAPTFNSAIRISSLSAAGAGTSFLQSYQYSAYQPGKSQLIAVTFVIGAGVAGVTKDNGYFDSSNGVFFRQNGVTNLQMILRSSTSGAPVDTAIAQASWNMDRLDGTGSSGFTLDVTKAQIWFCDLQFLGMGRVRTGFDIDGVFVVAHEFRNANVLTVPYMQSASLPVQALLTSAGNAASMQFKCCTVISEGGYQLTANVAASTPSISITAASGARTHAISVRPKLLFNALTNRASVVLESFELLVTGNSPVYWELCIGAALSAITWANTNTLFSGVEHTTAATFTNLTNGLVIQSGYVPATSQTKGSIEVQLPIQFPLTLDRAGANRNLGTLTLLVTGLGGASACQASMVLYEVR